MTQLLTTSDFGVSVRPVNGNSDPIQITDSMVSSARFSPDGLSVVTATNLNFGAFFGAFPDGVTVWPLDGGDSVTLTNAATNDAAFNEEATLIVAAGFESATVWTSDGRQVATLPAGATTSAEFSDDGSTIVTTGLDGVMVWQTPGTDNTTLTDQPSEAGSYSADGSRIIAQDAAVDRRIGIGFSVWSADGSLVEAFEPTFGAAAGALSPDGTLIAHSDDFGASVRQLGGTEQYIRDDFAEVLEFDPDGTNVLLVSDGLERWHFADDRTSSMGGGSGVRDVDFSADGTLLVAAGFDGVALLDDAGNELRRITDVSSDRVDLDPGGTRIVTAGSDGVVVRSIAGDAPQVILTSQQASSVGFNADGTGVVTAGAQGVVIRDLAGNVRSIVTTSPTSSAVFSPDGTMLLTAGDDGVKLWRVWTEQAIRPVLEARVGDRRFSPQECEEFGIRSCPTVAAN